MLVQLGNTNSIHTEPSAEAMTTFCLEPEILKAGLTQPVSHANGPEGLVTVGRPGDTQIRGSLAQSQAVVLTTAEKSGQNISEEWSREGFALFATQRKAPLQPSSVPTHPRAHTHPGAGRVAHLSPKSC
ncbi:hypothetical protein CapIbe_013863 [Capra ibex]